MPAPRTAIFMVISVAVHAAALAWWPQSDPTPSGIARAIDVTMQTPTQVARPRSMARSGAQTPTLVAKKFDSPPAPSHVPDPAPEVDDTTPAPEPSELAAVTDPPQLETGTLDHPPDSARPSLTLVITYLIDSIERKKEYPWLARQRGKEGVVILTCRILRDGTIDQVTVARSSGHVLLDDSAVRALQDIRRVSPELWHAGDSTDLELPITYRLIKS